MTVRNDGSIEREQTQLAGQQAATDKATIARSLARIIDLETQLARSNGEKYALRSELHRTRNIVTAYRDNNQSQFNEILELRVKVAQLELDAKLTTRMMSNAVGPVWDDANPPTFEHVCDNGVSIWDDAK